MSRSDVAARSSSCGAQQLRKYRLLRTLITYYFFFFRIISFDGRSGALTIGGSSTQRSCGVVAFADFSSPFFAFEFCWKIKMY
jgi:hypothetical protein